MTYIENYFIMKKNTVSFLMLHIREIFYKARAVFWHFYHDKEFGDSCGFFSRMYCEKCNYNFANQTVCSWQPVKVSLNHNLHFSSVGRGEKSAFHNLWTVCLSREYTTLTQKCLAHIQSFWFLIRKDKAVCCEY